MAIDVTTEVHRIRRRREREIDHCDDPEIDRLVRVVGTRCHDPRVKRLMRMISHVMVDLRPQEKRALSAIIATAFD